MQDLVQVLRGIEFFQGIPDEHLERVAAIAKVVEFPAHHVIFREAEPGKSVYIIVEGRISLVICAPGVGCRQLMEAGTGELIGWSPLVGRLLVSDTAHTLTPIKAIALEGERILALCREDARFGFAFMMRAAQTLAARLGAARMQIFKSNFVTLPQVQLESD